MRLMSTKFHRLCVCSFFVLSCLVFSSFILFWWETREHCFQFWLSVAPEQSEISTTCISLQYILLRKKHEIGKNVKKDVDICWQVMNNCDKMSHFKTSFKSLETFFEKMKKVWTKSRKKSSNNNRDFDWYASWKWLLQQNGLDKQKVHWNQLILWVNVNVSSRSSLGWACEANQWIFKRIDFESL